MAHLLKLVSHFRKLLQSRFPFMFSDEIPRAFSFAHNYEHRSFIKNAIIGPLHVTFIESDNKFSCFVDFKSYFDCSHHNENNFIDFIELFKEYASCLLNSWLQVCHDFYHEVFVVLVVPLVKLIVVNTFFFVLVIVCRNSKNCSLKTFEKL